MYYTPSYESKELVLAYTRAVLPTSPACLPPFPRSSQSILLTSSLLSGIVVEVSSVLWGAGAFSHFWLYHNPLRSSVRGNSPRLPCPRGRFRILIIFSFPSPVLSIIRFVLDPISIGISVTLVDLFKQKLNKNLLCVDSHNTKAKKKRKLEPLTLSICE